MKISKKVLLVAVVASLLTGCAHQPTPEEVARWKAEESAWKAREAAKEADFLQHGNPGDLCSAVGVAKFENDSAKFEKLYTAMSERSKNNNFAIDPDLCKNLAQMAMNKRADAQRNQAMQEQQSQAQYRQRQAAYSDMMNKGLDMMNGPKTTTTNCINFVPGQVTCTTR